MKNLTRPTASLLILVLLLLVLTSCGMQSYNRLGISFELPSGLSERALAGAEMCFGDDKTLVVFNKFDKRELASIDGLSGTDVRSFTEYNLEKLELSVSPVYNSSGTRAVFDYVVGDDEEPVYYYYYTLIIDGSDCIWVVQMSCYEGLMYEYAEEFESWGRNIKAE